LAWMEPSLLSPEQVKRLAPVIKKYNEIRDELFSGDIYPIGEKPSGRSITGFQSHNEKTGTGFVCAYREVTPRPGAVMQLRRIPASKKMVFNLLLGKGTVSGENGGYRFALPESRSFALWKYAG
jgi:alpha-galactosidase